MGLAVMGLIFPMAALIVPWFVLVARKVFWLLLRSPGTASRLSPLTSGLGVGKILEGDTGDLN